MPESWPPRREPESFPDYRLDYLIRRAPVILLAVALALAIGGEIAIARYSADRCARNVEACLTERTHP